MVRVSRIWLGNGAEWIAVQDPETPSFYLCVATKNGEESEADYDGEDIVLKSVGSTHQIEHMNMISSPAQETYRLSHDRFSCRITVDGETDLTSCYSYFRGPFRHKKRIIEESLEAIFREYDEEQFEVQRSVIAQELREAAGDREWTKLSDVMKQMLYPGTPYGLSYLDILKHVPGLDMRMTMKIRDDLMRGNNITIVTVSKDNRRELEPYVRGAFEMIPAGNRWRPYPVDIAHTEKLHHVEARDYLPTCFVQHNLRTSKVTPEMMATMDVLSNLLGVPDTGTLYVELREKIGSVYAPSVETNFERPAPSLDILYTCEPRYLDMNHGVVHKQMESLAENLVMENELNKYRDFARRNKGALFDTTYDTIQWLVVNSSQGIYITPRQYLKLIEQVSPEHVREMAYDIVNNGIATVVFRPG